MRTITVWENDMTNEIDYKVLNFLNLYFNGYEIKQLSGLNHRDEKDIIESVRDSYAIVI
jgi:hypothetical protein